MPALAAKPIIDILPVVAYCEDRELYERKPPPYGSDRAPGSGERHPLVRSGSTFHVGHRRCRLPHRGGRRPSEAEHARDLRGHCWHGVRHPGLAAPVAPSPVGFYFPFDELLSAVPI